MNIKKMIILRKARNSVKEFNWVTDHPIECQERFIVELARRNRDTLFGRRHHFERIGSIDDYQKRVPVHDYDALVKYMKLIMRGEKDILFPGSPFCWAKTSGTTSEPKLIPVPREMTGYFSEVGSRLLYSFIMENPKENIDALSGKLLFLRAPSRVGEVNGVPAGYISGISGDTQSRFASRMVVPSKETSAIGNWEDKFYRTVMETVGENVTMIVGVAPLLMSMFQRMADEYPDRLLHDLGNEETTRKIQQVMRKRGGRLLPRDCWENLKLFCPSSASMKPYMARYRNLFGDAPVREAYGATEGQFGQQVEEDGGLLLNWDKYLFEFIPFSGNDGAQSAGSRLIVSELRAGGIYEVLVTTPFGLYSYQIGDVLRLEKKEPHTFVVVGRTKMTLNLFGEKVCEEHISTAIRAAEETTSSVVAEYTCTASRDRGVDARSCYVLCVEFVKCPIDKGEFINTWDRKLQEIAPAYGCFRTNDSVLKPPEMVALAKGTFQEYERKRMRSPQAWGQLKLPHIDSGAQLLGELRIAL